MIKPLQMIDNAPLLPRVGEAGRGLKGRWHVPDPMNQYLSPYVGMGNRPSSMIDPDGMWSDAAYMSNLRGYDAYRLSKYRAFYNYNCETNVLGKSMDDLNVERIQGNMNTLMQDAYSISIDNIIIGVSNHAGADASRSVLLKKTITAIIDVINKLQNEQETHEANSNNDGVQILMVRLAEDDEMDYTLGVYSVDGELFGYTLERGGPSSMVEGSKKRIVAGTYDLVSHSGDQFKSVWRLKDVPGRRTILIHNGSYVRDTDGCILFGYHNPKEGMINGSKDAINDLRKHFDSNGTKGASITIYDLIIL